MMTTSRLRVWSTVGVSRFVTVTSPKYVVKGSPKEKKGNLKYSRTIAELKKQHTRENLRSGFKRSLSKLGWPTVLARKPHCKIGFSSQ
ncbi:hypothetical protein TNCV_2007431 [Trichonephila clavipes]|nr:hypothetical protein TNCV_2007431 [Trichonephila clavipes]